MQNKKAIIVVSVSLAVGIVMLVALRFWPESQSRLADKALTNAIDQAGKYIDAGESLLANLASEHVGKDGTVDRGPWGKDLLVDLAKKDPTLFLNSAQLTDEKKRAAQEAKWKELVEADKVPYRLVMAPTVNPKVAVALEAAQKQLKEALTTHRQKGTLKVVALADEKLGMAWLLSGRALARQAELSRGQVYQRLAEASACLDAIARGQAQADSFGQAKDKIAKGVDPQVNEKSKVAQADLKTKREAAEAEAAQLRKDAKDAQDKGDQLRKEANEEKILGANGTGQAAAETTLKAIEKEQAAGQAHTQAEELEKKLVDKEREIAKLKIEEIWVGDDLTRDTRTQKQQADVSAVADAQIAEINKQILQQQATLSKLLADAAGWLTDKECQFVEAPAAAPPAAPAAEKPAEVGSGEEAPAAPATAPATVAKQAPAAGSSLPVPGAMAAQDQARHAFLEAQEALESAAPPSAAGGDATDRPRPETKVAQGAVRLAKASLAFDAIALAEQVQDVLLRLDRLLPQSELAQGPIRAKLATCLVEPKLVERGAMPTSGPATADLNERRFLAAEECKDAAKQFEQAALFTAEPKLQWTSYTLSGLAWEKAYYLLAGRRLDDEAAAKQNATDMADARKAAGADALKALTGSGAEDRKESPFLAPALLLQARLDAIK